MTNSPSNIGGRKESWEALMEILSRCRRHACFRYPIDGPDEIEQAFDDAIEKVFGPEPADSPYVQWVRKLRRNGLIP